MLAAIAVLYARMQAQAAARLKVQAAPAALQD